MKNLSEEDCVLVIGNSSEPFLCTKKDEKAFTSFWDKKIYLPLPDYSSRSVFNFSQIYKYYQLKYIVIMAWNI